MGVCARLFRRVKLDPSPAPEAMIRALIGCLGVVRSFYTCIGRQRTLLDSVHSRSLVGCPNAAHAGHAQGSGGGDSMRMSGRQRRPAERRGPAGGRDVQMSHALRPSGRRPEHGPHGARCPRSPPAPAYRPCSQCWKSPLPTVGGRRSRRSVHRPDGPAARRSVVLHVWVSRCPFGRRRRCSLSSVVMFGRLSLWSGFSTSSSP